MTYFLQFLGLATLAIGSIFLILKIIDFVRDIKRLLRESKDNSNNQKSVTTSIESLRIDIKDLKYRVNRLKAVDPPEPRRLILRSLKEGINENR